MSVSSVSNLLIVVATEYLCNIYAVATVATVATNSKGCLRRSHHSVDSLSNTKFSLSSFKIRGDSWRRGDTLGIIREFCRQLTQAIGDTGDRHSGWAS